MARSLKPQQVYQISHTIYGEVPLFLDRNNLTFFAEVAGERVEAADMETLKRLVNEELAKHTNLDWRPIIEVRNESSGSWETKTNRVSFRFQRYYVTQIADGTYRQADWADDPAKLRPRDRYNTNFSWPRGTEFNPPCNQQRANYGPDKTLIYLPYTEANWEALVRLDTMLRELKARLEELLFTPEQAAMLPWLLGKMRLLTGGEE